jgi:hypothetical protein
MNTSNDRRSEAKVRCCIRLEKEDEFVCQPVERFIKMLLEVHEAEGQWLKRSQTLAAVQL